MTTAQQRADDLDQLRQRITVLEARALRAEQLAHVAQAQAERERLSASVAWRLAIGPARVRPDGDRGQR